MLNDPVRNEYGRLQMSASLSFLRIAIRFFVKLSACCVAISTWISMRSRISAKDEIRECSICNNITDADPWLFCASPSRDRRLICVAEDATNIQAIEKTRQFNGLYHVLGGALSPLQGVGAEQLKIKSLIERLKEGSVQEIIIATNRTAEGEATTTYLSQPIKPLGIPVTRIAKAFLRAPISNTRTKPPCSKLWKVVATSKISRGLP